MGYYTDYTLRILSGDETDEMGERLIWVFRKSCDSAEYTLTQEGATKQGGTWYEHEKDLLVFSKMYPNTVFELSGEGEDAGDLWRKYFKGGKVQVAKASIVYTEYDEKLLK